MMKILICSILSIFQLISYTCGQIVPLIPTLTPCIVRNENTECPDKDMKFLLYSGFEQDIYEMINVTDRNWIKTSRFNPNLPTVVLIHGFSEANRNSMDVLKEAYIRRGTHNVVLVDWKFLAPLHCYIQARNSLKGVAKCTAQMLVYLEAAGDVNSQNITCIGHSLGAHICGLIPNFADNKLDKIVGLDPARPLLQGMPNSEILDSKDAKIVQVIHTGVGFFGMPGLIGTADFCVNTGLQGYCQSNRMPLLCSHLQAICYYAESLFPEKRRRGNPCIPACPQLNITRAGDEKTLGEHMEENASGMYCISSNEAPYCPKTKKSRADNGDMPYGDERCCP